MNTIEFAVQGSAQEPYRVTFRRIGNEIAAFCTCPAGDNGQVCKHRSGILAGSAEGIVSGNAEQAAVVVSWLPGSNIEAALAAVERAERGAEQAKKDLSKAKKLLGAAMMGRAA